ncbi:MAG: hypothetical protein ACYTJ0_02615 [Planctomycetota bacterium]
MSLSSARTQLKGSFSDLKIKWDQTRETWDDPMSRAFEKEFIEPFERLSHSAIAAMDEMLEVLTRIQRDCG